MTTGWFGDGEGSLAGLQTLEACFEIKEKAGPALKKKEREMRAAPKEEEVGIGCGPFSSISIHPYFRPTFSSLFWLYTVGRDLGVVSQLGQSLTTNQNRPHILLTNPLFKCSPF